MRESGWEWREWNIGRGRLVGTLGVREWNIGSERESGALGVGESGTLGVSDSE